MGTQVSFKKLMTRTNVSTFPQDIQRSKLVKNINVDAKFGKTC